MEGIFKQLRKLWPAPAAVPPQSIQEPEIFSEKDRRLLKQIGVSSQTLVSTLTEQTQLNFERVAIYREVDRALEHALMGAAAELYADYCTVYNPLQNASVWITSDNQTYLNNLTKLLDDIGAEEKIFDWGHTCASYGDLFIKVNGMPGVGITHIDDGLHPANISRVDYDGALIGFFKTPFEVGGGLGMPTGGQTELISPWDYVHFRVLGAKKKRPLYSDPSYSEYRTVSLMGASTKQLTSKYGTSLLINALPVYKRLRMAEDSIMMARLTRGIMKYVYKISVSGSNIEAVGELVDEYVALLKNARAVNTEGDGYFDSKFNPMASVEDIFIPVWGDAKNDLVIDKIGGETDIRWIKDIEELRNMLACALRTPLALLGGFIKEATGSLGSEALEKLDIRFARASRRVQRALINGITRMCQIHLVYQNMDPDPELFEVHMSETSTAEEAELTKTLETNVDAISRFMEMLDAVDPRFDKVEILTYFNQKILKLNDLDLKEFLKTDMPLELPEGEEGASASARPAGPGAPMGAAGVQGFETPAGEQKAGEEEIIIPEEGRMPSCRAQARRLDEGKAIQKQRIGRRRCGANQDLLAPLPVTEGCETAFPKQSIWEDQYRPIVDEETNERKPMQVNIEIIECAVHKSKRRQREKIKRLEEQRVKKIADIKEKRI